MNKFVLSLALIVSIFVSNIALSQDKVFFETLPVPSGVQPSNDPSIPKISWNRWTTKNFSIHSIDFDQGEYLFRNIENMKSWCLQRWGLPDIQFASECRIFCAPTKEMMKKLFNLESSYGEVKIQDGKIVISYLWLVLDAKPAEIIPPALTIVCMKEFNQKYQLNLGWWVYRGMPIMNASLPQIRAKLAFGKPNTFSAKNFFAMTETQWKKLTVEQRHAFDAEAALMCLFLRKEYGQAKFQSFLKSDNYENNIMRYLGFNDVAQFEETFKRYAGNLTTDIQQNKAPDAYLQVEAIAK